MTVTASKLGQSRLWMDWSRLRNHQRATLQPDTAAWQNAWKKLLQRFESAAVAFFSAPEQDSLSQLEASIHAAEKKLKEKPWSDCLFIGIGGSALGPRSLLEALEHRRKNNIRFHFLENPDPHHYQLTLRHLRPESTIVVLVTKSGSTFETLAQSMLALEWLGKNNWRSQVIVITDPQKGDLRLFAQKEGLITLDIAPGMGGRFSIFSPVGLFAAAVGGLDAQSFMTGALEIKNHLSKTDLEKSPLFLAAQFLLDHEKSHPVHVCMPYSTRLQSFSQWWVQLWGESLGKDGRGFTPLSAIGATDQHSLLQLLRDGPKDKIVFFITVEKNGNPAPIPQGISELPAFKILAGHSLEDLLRIEYQATETVLSRAHLPNLSLRLEELNERNMGSLYFYWSMMTAVLGTLMGVNPFDQPGVEEGKGLIRESLSSLAQSQRDAHRFHEESDSERAFRRLRQDSKED